MQIEPSTRPPSSDDPLAERQLELAAALDRQDDEFVRAIYRLLLARDPDAAGLESYLAQVRAGVDRILIATDIAHSEEATQRNPVWQRLLPLRKERFRGLSWLRRRLLGAELGELQGAINRLDNRLFRMGRELPTLANPARPALAAGAPRNDDPTTTPPRVDGGTTAVSGCLLVVGGSERVDPAWPAPMRRSILLPRRALESRVAERQALSVLLDGQFSGTYSLAITNRELARSLLRQGDGVDVAIQPREAELTDDIRDLPGGDDDYGFYRRLLQRGREVDFAGRRYVRLYHSWPPVRHRRNPGEVAIAVFFWEESVVPAEIIDLFNEQYDGIVVCTWFVKKTLIDCGCKVPIELTPFPHELLGGNQPQSPARRAERRWIEFLHVSSCFARKGVDALLRAFSELALRLPNVRLTIKTFDNPHLEVREQFEALVDPRVRDRVTIRIEDLSDMAMAELYRSADAVVLPSRGEGLNMPVIEAAYYRVPVIATGYTGQADFATADNSYPVSFAFEPSRSHLERDGSLWCEPSHEDLVRRMREVALCLMSRPDEVWARADRLTALVHETFLHPRATEGFRRALQRLAWHADQASTSGRPSRIALVSSWMERCGIAEYSSFLGAALQRLGIQVSVLAPEHDGSLDGSPLPARKGSWRQSMYFRVDGSELGDAEVVWFQHHPGFYALGDDVRRTVRQLGVRGVPCFITLHSTSELLLDPGRLVDVIACLREFERVIVHSTLDRNVLLDCGLTENVVVIPHGVVPAIASKRPTLSPGADRVRIGCFGFLLRHKGVDRLIEMLAVARSDPSAPDISLRLVNSVRGDEQSVATHRECLALAQELGVSERIEWHTGYLPQDELMALLADCDVLVLPYQPTSESASGAVRLALAACPHVLVSAEPIFDEVRDCTVMVRATSGASLWKDLHSHLQQVGTAEDQQRLARRANWLANRAWPAVAATSAALVGACLTDRHYSAVWEQAV